MTLTAERARAVAPPRRAYIDWLRGVGVLVMIEAHLFDAWTAVADRSRPAYSYAMILAGFAAPIFLFLAGLSLMLAIGARVSGGASDAEAAKAAQRRGWQIFGLAFLFRLQSWILSGGAPFYTLFKVDILNIMGPTMVAAAVLWIAGGNRRGRMAVLLGGATVIAMATPVVRATPLLASFPDPVEAYLRPLQGRANFALFPWAGFLLAGAAIGLLLESTRTAADERRANLWLAATGAVVGLAGYGASFLPAIYMETSFWTTSPTFFFLRLGLLIALIPLAYAWDRRPWGDPAARRGPLLDFGRASLFVYWIHVEMAYGAMSHFLHKRFSLEEMVVAYLLFTAMLLVLTRVKHEFSKPLMTRRLLSRV